MGKTVMSARNARKLSELRKDNPGGIDARRIVGPADREQQRLDVLLAMNTLRTKFKSGRRSEAWRLDQRDLYTVACLHVVDHKPSTTASEAVADEMKRHRVSVRTMEEWLSQVRRVTARLEETRLKRIRASVGIRKMGTNLSRIQELVLAELAVVAVQRLEMGDVFESDPKERDSLLRMVEAISAGAKVQADAAHKNMLSEKVREAMEATESAARTAGRELTAAERMEIYNGVMRGKPGATAPTAKGGAA